MSNEERHSSIVNLGRSIFGRYEGKIIEEEKGISLVSTNDICGKKVECKCSIGLLSSEKYPFSVDGSEKTCQLLGGVCIPCENFEEVKEEVMKVLFRYKFKQKDQLSLFDFDD